MQKAHIIIKINDYVIQKQGTIDNGVLKVKDNDDNIIFDIKNQVFTKENKDLKITIDFTNNKVLYELIKENAKFSNNFDILSLTNHDKQVIIIYQIENTDFNLEISYETI